MCKASIEDNLQPFKDKMGDFIVEGIKDRLCFKRCVFTFDDISKLTPIIFINYSPQNAWLESHHNHNHKLNNVRINDLT